MWKADLKPINSKAAEALADPEKYPNLFPDFEWALKVSICVGYKGNRLFLECFFLEPFL